MVLDRLHINRFHLLVFVTWQLSLFLANQLLFPIFTNYSPNWRCAMNNETEAFGKNCSLLAECPPELVEYDTLPFYSTVMEFEMLCGADAYIASLISSAQFGGVLIGTITYGHLGDKFGRKPIALICVTLGILLIGLSAASPVWHVLMALRFLIGTSLGGTLIVVYTYVIELILAEQRMFLRSFFNWGWARVVLTFVCALVPHWRWASVATAVLPVPILLIIYFVFPESPTWLENKGRFAEMNEAEQKIARIAGLPKPIAKQRHEDSRLSEVSSKVYTLADLFEHKEIAKRTLILCLIWFTASLCSYVNDLNSRSLAGDFYWNQILFAFMVALSKVMLFVMDTYVPHFSRRMLHQLSQASVVICFTAIMFLIIFHVRKFVHAQIAYFLSILSWLQDNPKQILIVNVIGTMFIEYTWDACYLCGVEGFPTEVRAIGVGTCSLTARIGAILAPQLAFLGRLWKPSPYLTVAALGAVTLLMSWLFLPETKGADLGVRERKLTLINSAALQQKAEEEMGET